MFNDELGALKDVSVKLSVHENTTPRFYKPRPVSFLLKEKIDKELDDLLAKGIIVPVQSSPWAAPVVPVLKKNDWLRLCEDYKLTINQAAITET